MGTGLTPMCTRGLALSKFQTTLHRTQVITSKRIDDLPTMIRLMLKQLATSQFAPS
jgi:hypothetical protein